MEIKVVCLNMWLGGILFDEVEAFLRQEDADIVMLQEVFNSQDSQLERRFRAVQAIQEALNYPEYDFDRCFTQQLDFGTVDRGNLILSKLPILERQSSVLFGEDGVYEDIRENFGKFRHNLQQVVVDGKGKPLNIFNFQGIWDLDGDRNSPERLRMSQKIVTAIKDKQHVILAGDTNAKPSTQAIKNIEKLFTNVFMDELTTSFNLRHKDLVKYPGYAEAVVDMAFVSPDISVVDHYCPDINVSDHLPLVFTVRLN